MGSAQRKHPRHSVSLASRSRAHAGASRVAAGAVASSESSAVAAVRQLQALAPTLHEQPDLLREVRHILQLAEARHIAIATGNAWSGIGAAAPDLWRGAGGGIGSPTGSTPQASSPSGQLGGWAGSKDAPKGVMNARILRNYADHDPWVAAVIKLRGNQVARADVDVTPLDYDKPFDKKLQTQLKRLFTYPNELRDSYTSLMKRVVRDLLVLDRGCVSKGMNARRQPLNLYSEDGATIKIYANWDGNPKTPRYLFEEPGSTRKVPLRNDELICIMADEATYRFGLSPVQVLLDTIEADLQATQSAKDLVTQKPPPHVIQIPGAGDMAIKQLRADYEAMIAGKREILFLGGEEGQQAVVKPLIYSLKDSQWLEWQEYLARKICAQFQVSPQQIGITFDINRANGEVQQQAQEDDGLDPILLLIEDYYNREILSDYAPLAKDGKPDLEALNLCFKFPQISEAARLRHVARIAGIAKDALANAPFMTINMALEEMGEEPIPGGNTLYVISPTNGPIPWLSYDGETGDFGPYAPATIGAVGGQEAVSGMEDEDDERDADDTRASKPPQSAAPPQPVGDESSGDGNTPNVPTNDATTNDGKALAPHHTAQIPTTSGGRVIPLRRDLRRPGQAWRPSDSPRVQPRNAQARVNGASSVGMQQPRMPTPLRTTITEQVAQQLALLADTQAQQALLEAAQREVQEQHDTALTFGLREAQLLSTAISGALLELAAKPTPVGRVDELRSQAHRRPHKEQDARAQLQAAVKSVFETARMRGAQALSQRQQEQQQAAFRHVLLSAND